MEKQEKVKRGRPATGRRPNMNFRVPPAQRQIVEELARVRRVNMSDVAREIFERGLATLGTGPKQAA